jgi:hypothetical protein
VTSDEEGYELHNLISATNRNNIQESYLVTNVFFLQPFPGHWVLACEHEVQQIPVIHSTGPPIRHD